MRPIVALAACVSLLLCSAARAADGDLVVTVVGADGKPVGGVTVRAEIGVVCCRGARMPATKATTAADGTAVFEGIEAFEVRSVFAEEKEGRVACAGATEENGFHGRVELRLRAASVLRGRVVAPDGSSVTADADLHWFAAAGDDGGYRLRTVRTGPGGAFAFPALPRLAGDEQGWGEVTAPGFVQATLRFGAETRVDEPIVVRLEPGVRVRGRCVDQRGRPMEDFTVRTGRRRGQAEPHGTGRFVVEGVPRQGGAIVVSPRDFEPVEVAITDGMHGDVDVHDVVFRTQTMRGVFVDTNGKPIEKASVVLTPHDTRFTTRSGDTAADGAFEIDGLPDTVYDVEASHGGCCTPKRTAEAGGVPSGTTDLRLVTGGMLPVRFRLLAAADRSPVAFDYVAVEVVRRAEGKFAFVSRRGFQRPSAESVIYELAEPGTFSADVRVKGFAAARVEDFVVSADGANEVEVLLTPDAQ